MDLIALLANDPIVRTLARRAIETGRVTARGSVGSSTPMLAAALARHTKRLVLLVVAHADEADEAADTMAGAGAPVHLFPAMQTLPGESAVSLDLMAARLAVVQEAKRWSADAGAAAGAVLVAPIHALMQPVPSAAQLAAALITLKAGEQRDPVSVVRWLEQAGYKRTDAVEEPGDYAVRGGILDIFSPGDPTASAGAITEDGRPMAVGGVPVRLDFFGDALDKITEIDLDTMGSDRTVGGARLVSAAAPAADRDAMNLVDMLPGSTLAVLAELLEITEQGRGYFERLTGTHEIFGPPAVFKAIGARAAATIEATAIGPYSSGARGETGAGSLIELPVGPLPPLDDDALKAVADVAALADPVAAGRSASEAPPHRVLVLCQNAAEQTRFGELLREAALGSAGRIETAVQYVHLGFVWTPTDGDTRPVLVLPYHELLHRFQTRRKLGGFGGASGQRLRAGRAMDTFLDLQVGDYVVHNEHGIARFIGLRTTRQREAKASVDDRLHGRTPTAPEEPKGPPEEYLTLEFEGGVKLHVPATKIDQVQKYIGGFRGSPPLSSLGGTRWKNQKQRVSDSVRDLAAELLRVRAAREHMPGIRFPADTPWQTEFEAEFPYTDTEDQTAALAEIKRDMHSPRPMDRLLCGDVGYGKTEMAIRAAFKAAEYGKQVAVLVPTTVLAEQHERTFKSRFADYPFRIESISRFKSDAQVRETLEDLSKGRIDILIGTHRLLSADVKFSDLGLVIIDEEQRFGVEHKEKLLSLRMTVDVLTLSATPIPRTLHMSMLGLRDISSLATAPVDRRAVVTEVIPYNEARLKQILARELAREGQVYYVHNRVYDIEEVTARVQSLAPDARVVFGHGQMAGKELEDVMLRFMRRQADILVSTTIIESGIDNPTANTMIIDDADRFGLADLHQLRGRVGRYKHRAYCYLLLPDNRPLKEIAKKRLKAIEQFSMLGAGFKIAMRDLEIRGAGNILGPEQSGHIATVGYDMYCQLLERAVKEMRNEITAAPSETIVEIGISGVIPKPYIPSDSRRLEAYRRIALAASAREVEQVETDLVNAYGPLPEHTARLLQLAEVRIGAREAGVRSINVKDKDVIIRTTDQQAVVARFEGSRGRATALPVRAPGDVPEVYYRPDNPAALEPPSLLAMLRKRFGVRAEKVELPTPSKPPAPAAPPMPAVRKPATGLTEVRRVLRAARRPAAPPPSSENDHSEQ